MTGPARTTSSAPAETVGASAIRTDEFNELVRRQRPKSLGFDFRAERFDRGLARVRLHFHESHLRSGGTISGPTLFTLADASLYAAVLTVIGLVPLTVTTDMTIRFLRKPPPADLVAEARLVKSTGRLLVGDIVIYSDGDPDPVCHASGTYAVPARLTQPAPRG